MISTRPQQAHWARGSHRSKISRAGSHRCNGDTGSPEPKRKTVELPPLAGKCRVGGLELLVKSGCPRPGTGGMNVGHLAGPGADG